MPTILLRVLFLPLLLGSGWLPSPVAAIRMNALSQEMSHAIAGGLTEGGDALLAAAGMGPGQAAKQAQAMMVATGAVSLSGVANSVAAYQTMQIANSLRQQNNLIERGNADRHRQADAAEHEVALFESRERASEILDTLSGLVLESMAALQVQEQRFSGASSGTTSSASELELSAYVFVPSSNLRLRCVNQLEAARRKAQVTPPGGQDRDQQFISPALLQGMVRFYPLDQGVFEDIMQEIKQQTNEDDLELDENTEAKNKRLTVIYIALPSAPAPTIALLPTQLHLQKKVAQVPAGLRAICSASKDADRNGAATRTRSSDATATPTAPFVATNICPDSARVFPEAGDKSSLVVYVDSQTTSRGRGRASAPGFVLLQHSATSGGSNSNCPAQAPPSSPSPRISGLRRFENVHFALEAPDVATWRNGTRVAAFRDKLARSGVSLDPSCQVHCVLPAAVHVPDEKLLDEKIASCSSVFRYSWEWAPLLVNLLGDGIARGLSHVLTDEQPTCAGAASCGAASTRGARGVTPSWAVPAFLLLQTQLGQHFVVDFADARRSDGSKGIQLLGPYATVDAAMRFNEDAAAVTASRSSSFLSRLDWKDVAQTCWYVMSPVTCPFYGPWVERSVNLASDDEITATGTGKGKGGAVTSATDLTLGDLVQQMQKCDIAAAAGQDVDSARAFGDTLLDHFAKAAMRRREGAGADVNV